MRDTITPERQIADLAAAVIDATDPCPFGPGHRPHKATLRHIATLARQLAEAVQAQGAGTLRTVEADELSW